MTILSIHSEMVEIAATYNKDVNNDSVGIKYILTKGEEWMEIDKITTKELQRTLKLAKKNSTQDFNERLGTIDYNKENISKFRNQCKNVFEIGNKANVNKIKIKIIQGMIQMERPKNWTMDNIMNYANEINRIEIYNAKKKGRQK